MLNFAIGPMGKVRARPRSEEYKPYRATRPIGGRMARVTLLEHDRLAR
jgi:hypothetical protein